MQNYTPTNIFIREDKEKEPPAGAENPVQEPPASRPDEFKGEPSRKIQAWELAAFLFLIVPSMATSFMISGSSAISFTTTAVLSILSDLGEVGLVFYFVWRNREPLSQLGWTTKKLPKEVIWGIVLFFPVVLVSNWIESIMLSLGLTAPSKLPSMLVAAGGSQAVLAFLLVVVVAIVEETVFRGYLLLRLQTVTRRPWAAVLLSSLIFSIGHGYEGTAGVVRVFFVGVFFAVIYLWRKSLVAPMVIHFMVDFSSIVMTALMAMKF